MNGETIRKVQAYLTIPNNGSLRRKVIDVEILLKRHGSESVIQFLKGLLKQKEKKLVHLVTKDQSSCEIEFVLGEMFRLHMAIKILEDEDEEVRFHCQN